MGKIHRRRFPRRWPTSRRAPAAVTWAAVSRVVVRDGLPRPISSSWTGSAAQIKRSLQECRATWNSAICTNTWNRGAQRQRFSARLLPPDRASDLIRHGDDGYDLELSYFQIGGWNSNSTVDPVDPEDWHWLTMRCPGGFLQANQKPGQGMAWDYSSQLYNAEFNVRWNPSCRVTMLAGFRWVNLGEKLVGALDPPTICREPPFWNTTTINNLYGLQVGSDWKIWERGRFSIDGLAKAGIYDDNAEETTGVSVIVKQVRASVRFDQPRRLRWRNRLAVQVSS